MPLAETAAGSIYYVEQRDPESGLPPVILIHGAGSDHLVWPPALRRLGGARVIAPDLPGHGRSGTPGMTTVIAYAEAVRHLMRALDIARAIVVGHSMGGAIALTMGAHMRDDVAGLVLVGTGARLKVNPKILNTVRDDHEAVVDMITRWAWGPDAPEDLKARGKDQMLTIDPHTTFGDYLACDSFDITDQLSWIEAPTLVIGGTADKMAPLRLSQELVEYVSNATLVSLEDAGHMLPLERPDTIANHITQWLEQTYD
ncbi:MAG: alpha/beta hydrolase [Chloroflexi bacterium]|nr:alpha/beta hydrolase [Chloroflexota bacterium]